MAASTTKKVVIRIIVILFLITSGLTLLMYIPMPKSNTQPDQNQTNQYPDEELDSGTREGELQEPIVVDSVDAAIDM